MNKFSYDLFKDANDCDCLEKREAKRLKLLQPLLETIPEKESLSYIHPRYRLRGNIYSDYFEIDGSDAAEEDIPTNFRSKLKNRNCLYKL